MQVKDEIHDRYVLPPLKKSKDGSVTEKEN
jgi:hypothetical protein